MATISLRVDDALKARLDEVTGEDLNATAIFREALIEKLERIELGKDHHMQFELDLKERIILATQYELMAKLTEEVEDRKQYEFLVDTLRKGYSGIIGILLSAFAKR